MNIFVSRKIPSLALQKLLDSELSVKLSEFDRPLSAEEFLERARGSAGLLSLLTDKIDAEVMDMIGPGLKVISNYAVGYDNIDINEATNRGIVVCNTACDEVDEAVAEHAFSLMTSLSRRIVEADEATKRGAYRGWEPDIFLGTNLKGKTIGIVGLGGIGSKLAQKAKGYGMNVIYNKRTRDNECEEKMGVTYCSLDNLLSSSDVVSLHVPLSEETRHLINEENLSKMKKGAYLINTARGAVVEEHALVSFLRQGHLAGAALDVFENEPIIDPELIGMENVILTPHIASATVEAREKMGQLAVDAILKILKEDKMPENTVNPEVWEKRRK